MKSLRNEDIEMLEYNPEELLNKKTEDTTNLWVEKYSPKCLFIIAKIYFDFTRYLVVFCLFYSFHRFIKR